MIILHRSWTISYRSIPPTFISYDWKSLLFVGVDILEYIVLYVWADRSADILVIHEYFLICYWLPYIDVDRLLLYYVIGICGVGWGRDWHGNWHCSWVHGYLGIWWFMMMADIIYIWHMLYIILNINPTSPWLYIRIILIIAAVIIGESVHIKWIAVIIGNNF